MSPASYSDKQQFITIPIVAQAQQINVTPDSVCSRTHSFQDRKINFLAWKIIFPTSPSSPRYASIARSGGYI